MVCYIIPLQDFNLAILFMKMLVSDIAPKTEKTIKYHLNKIKNRTKYKVCIHTPTQCINNVWTVVGNICE